MSDRPLNEFLSLAVPALYIVVLVWALITLFMTDQINPTTRFMWAVAVLVLPFVGSIGWLLYRHYTLQKPVELR